VSTSWTVLHGSACVVLLVWWVVLQVAIMVSKD
jgi:hypothetical protein